MGGFGDLFLGLALGADEQHAAAAGDGVGHSLEGLVEKRNGLREVEDVDIGARAEDVRLHLRVPAVRLVTEVHAGLKELAHGELGKSHRSGTFFRFGLRGRNQPGNFARTDRRERLGAPAAPACGMARDIGETAVHGKSQRSPATAGMTAATGSPLLSSLTNILPSSPCSLLS